MISMICTGDISRVIVELWNCTRLELDRRHVSCHTLVSYIPKHATVTSAHLILLQLATTPQSGKPAPHSERNTPKQFETNEPLIRSPPTSFQEPLIRP